MITEKNFDSKNYPNQLTGIQMIRWILYLFFFDTLFPKMYILIKNRTLIQLKNTIDSDQFSD